MKMRLLVFLVALAFASSVGSVQGAIIFDNNAVVNQSFGSDADLFPGVNLPFFLADDFSLQPGANTVTDVHWRGLYSPSNTPSVDHFTIQIYADAGGTPAVSPLTSFAVGAAVNRVDTGTLLTNRELFAYSADIGPITLPAGTPFWLSIFNDTTSDPNENWFWAGQTGNGNPMFRNSVSGPWSSTQGQVAVLDFQLTGPTAAAIPQPPAIILWVIGLFALGLGLARSRMVNSSRP